MMQEVLSPGLYCRVRSRSQIDSISQGIKVLSMVNPSRGGSGVQLISFFFRISRTPWREYETTRPRSPGNRFQT